MPDPVDLSARVRALPGAEGLLAALAGLPPSYLVGGAVRDLLLGERSADLDVAVEGDARAAAGELAKRLGGTAVVHDRFGTATVKASGLSVDLASTRLERYEQPGALPMVEPAGLREDLERRDFTINAMAVRLQGADLGVLHDPLNGRADLEAGLVRVLHPRSFTDDPTRLLRALRYESRLGFALEPGTERLARQAARDGALRRLTGPRVRDELMDLLGEPEAPAAVARLRDLGLDTALHPALRADPDLAASAALGATETGADRALAGLAALCSAAPEELRSFVDGLGLTAASAGAVLRAARRAPGLAEELRDRLPASQLHALLAPEPPEVLALALGTGAPAGPVLRFLSELRGVRLEITGADLLAAGVPQSPAIGRALEQTLRRKLDGELTGRDEELSAAVALAGSGS